MVCTRLIFIQHVFRVEIPFTSFAFFSSPWYVSNHQNIGKGSSKIYSRYVDDLKMTKRIKKNYPSNSKSLDAINLWTTYYDTPMCIMWLCLICKRLHISNRLINLHDCLICLDIYQLYFYLQFYPSKYECD